MALCLSAAACRNHLAPIIWSRSFGLDHLAGIWLNGTPLAGAMVLSSISSAPPAMRPVAEFIALRTRFEPFSGHHFGYESCR